VEHRGRTTDVDDAQKTLPLATRLAAFFLRTYTYRMQHERPKISRNVLVIAFVALFSGFGQDLITPALPAYLALLGFSRAGIGLIDGLLAGAWNVFRFISGILSDRFKNRKSFVFLGYALSSVARPLLALFPSFGAIAALRVIDGVGKGTKDAPRDALVADSASPHTQGRAFGFQRLIDTAGSVLGPLVAGAMLLALTPSLHAYRTIFALAAIPGAIALGLIIFGIREPQPTARAAAARGKLPARFWLFTLAVFIAMLTKVNDSLMLVRAHEVGVPSAWIPVLFGGFTLLYAALSYPIGVWSDKVGKLPMIAAGWLVLSAVELGFSHDPSLYGALVLFALYGLFFALTEGSGRAFIAELVPPESRGSAYAIFYTVFGVATIVGGYGLGRVWDVRSPELAFTVAASGSLIAFIIFFALAARRRVRV
jgi:MFS family permease